MTLFGERSIAYSNDEKSGVIFDVQRFSLHDGPGLRVLVFLKGCPLRCIWCSNPESQGSNIEVMFESEMCKKNCTVCVDRCPVGAISKRSSCDLIVDSERCNGCGLCAKICPRRALKIVGTRVTSNALLYVIQRESPFFRRSGGGVTLGGGEPTFQPDFGLQILKGCQEVGIQTAIETCGYAPWSTLQKFSENADLVLFDLKQMDNAKHKRLTGVENVLILENLVKLSESRSNIVVRYPLIPSYNDTDKDIESLVEFLKLLRNVCRVELSPYHSFGEVKYQMLFRKYLLKGLRPHDSQQIYSIKQKIEANGIECRSLH